MTARTPRAPIPPDPGSDVLRVATLALLAMGPFLPRVGLDQLLCGTESSVPLTRSLMVIGDQAEGGGIAAAGPFCGHNQPLFPLCAGSDS